MSERVKTTIFEGLLMPILIYGSDNGTLTSRERSSFQNTERKTLEKKRERDLEIIPSENSWKLRR